MAASVYGAAAVQIVFPAPWGPSILSGPSLLSRALFTVPSVFSSGFSSRPWSRIASDEMKERAGGTVFYIESLGSFAGGMVFSFVLVTIANPAGDRSRASALSSPWACHARAPESSCPWPCSPRRPVFFRPDRRADIQRRSGTGPIPGKLVHYQRTKYQTVAIESAEGTVSVYGDGMLMYTLPDRYEARGLFHLVNALRGNAQACSSWAPGRARCCTIC